MACPALILPTLEAPPRHAMSFSLRAKQFFLTFPQCETNKQLVAERLQAKFGDNLAAYAIAAEHHAPTEQDPVGGPHLHILLHLKNRTQFSNANCFDFLTGSHGNYQVQKGPLQKVAEYLTKEDTEPLCFNIDLEAAKAKKASKFDTVAKMVLDGKTMEEIEEEHPGFVLNHKRKLDDYFEFQEAKRRKKVVTPGPHELIVNGTTIEIGTPRPYRQLQYYICGPPGTGKTSLITRLIEAGFRGYPIPYNGHWEEWSDEDYDFAYADEYNSQVKITEMNQFLTGELMPLNCRYRNKKKNKNVPTFIISNRALHDQYPNCPLAIRQAFWSRLTEITTVTFLEVELNPILPSPRPTTPLISSATTETVSMITDEEVEYRAEQLAQMEFEEARDEALDVLLQAPQLDQVAFRTELSRPRMITNLSEYQNK